MFRPDDARVAVAVIAAFVVVLGIDVFVVVVVTNAFVPSSFDVGADVGVVNIAVVVEVGIVAVNPSEVCNKVGTLF